MRKKTTKRPKTLLVFFALLASWRFSHSSSADTPLVTRLRGCDVNWTSGFISAPAGSAADFRLPTPDMARPGAERRARAVALAKLRAALEDLPLGGGRKLEAPALEATLGRARPAEVEYQSNGGVTLRMMVAFVDLTIRSEISDAGSAPVATLAVSAMPLEISPALSAGGQIVSLGFATYRVGAPPRDTAVLRARRDREGHLVLEESAPDAVQRLAGAPALIYVRKIQK